MPVNFNNTPAVVTHNSTPVTAHTSGINTGNICAVNAKVLAVSEDGDCAYFQLSGLIDRTGSLVVVGQLLDPQPIKSLGAALYAAELDASGGDLLVKVTGALAKDVAWYVWDVNIEGMVEP